MNGFWMTGLALGVAALAFCIGACIGPFFGAMAGYIVGWIFDETTVKVLTQLGLQQFQLWEIGAALGFFGGFFRSNFEVSAKS